jgi:hypothetical protein
MIIARKNKNNLNPERVFYLLLIETPQFIGRRKYIITKGFL